MATANAVLLFMNAEPPQGRRYPNEFTVGASPDAPEGGGSLLLSWFGDTSSPDALVRMAQRRAAGQEAEDGRAVLLFCRVKRDPYVFCGRVACGPAEPTGGGSGMRMQLRLLDAAALARSSAFRRIVRHASRYGNDNAWILSMLGGHGSVDDCGSEVTPVADAPGSDTEDEEEDGGVEQ